jgi:hypothetical protein
MGGLRVHNGPEGVVTTGVVGRGQTSGQGEVTKALQFQSRHNSTESRLRCQEGFSAMSDLIKRSVSGVTARPCMTMILFMVIV